MWRDIRQRGLARLCVVVCWVAILFDLVLVNLLSAMSNSNRLQERFDKCRGNDLLCQTGDFVRVNQDLEAVATDFFDQAVNL